MEATVCFFGYYDPDGARFRVIRDGLREHGIAVEECRTEGMGILAKYRDLWGQAMRQQFTVLFVTFPGHFLMPLAWLIGKRKRVPVIFDAFISLYDTHVDDRKLVGRFTPRALFYFVTDWISCRLATRIILDTPQHKEFFMQRFGIAPPKILVVPVGTRMDIFHPAASSRRRQGGDPLLLLFHGSFIPLQGIETILDAAKILQDQEAPVAFRLIGKGQTYRAMRLRAESLGLRNSTFVDPMPMEQLAEEIRHADAGFGIFGTSGKADRVIPHKAYDIIATKVPLLTGDTAAARAVFRHKKDALLSPVGDSAALAKNIELLLDDASFSALIAGNGYTLFTEKFTPRTIVRDLATFVAGRN